MKSIGFPIIFLMTALSCLAEEATMDMPIIEIPSLAQNQSPYMAVEWTGDAGFRKTDQTICKSLSSHGIPTVSVNSLRYFLKNRSPKEAGEACGRLIQHFGNKWNRTKVILIGYSFGADVIPFIFNKIPIKIKGIVSPLVIVSPSYKADFHFHILSWFGISGKNALPLIPELKSIHGTRLLFICGTKDSGSSGADLKKEKLGKVVMLNTGHRLGGDGGRVVDEILKVIDN